MKCGCNHSVAFVGGLFASLGAALFIAEDRCLDAGGRLSDVAWACEAPWGALSPLWNLVTPGVIAATLVLVGAPVYFAIAYAGRRWLFRYGNPQ
jgi:hypothetical protein